MHLQHWVEKVHLHLHQGWLLHHLLTAHHHWCQENRMSTLLSFLLLILIPRIRLLTSPRYKKLSQQLNLDTEQQGVFQRAATPPSNSMDETSSYGDYSFTATSNIPLNNFGQTQDQHTSDPSLLRANASHHPELVETGVSLIFSMLPSDDSCL